MKIVLLLGQVGNVRDKLKHGERNEGFVGLVLIDQVGVGVRVNALVVDDRVVHVVSVARDHRAADDFQVELLVWMLHLDEEVSSVTNIVLCNRNINEGSIASHSSGYIRSNEVDRKVELVRFENVDDLVDISVLGFHGKTDIVVDSSVSATDAKIDNGLQKIYI